MGDLDHIARCFDVQDGDIVAAISGRQRTRKLLAHLAAISAPNTGAAKVLLVLARMATTACDWIDGDLVIEVVSDGDKTRVDVGTELGGGLRERVFPTLELDVPLEELTRAIERVPHMIAPLAIAARSRKRIVLGASAIVRKTTVPPPPIEISAESLFVRIAPPGVPREGVEAASPVPLPVVDSALPVVGGAAPARPSPAAGSPAMSEPPPTDVDSGWDD